jgi:hypothetical protein
MLMTEPILNGADVMTGVGQDIAATVPQHVRMHREGETGALTDALDQPIDRVRRERAAALGFARQAGRRAKKEGRGEASRSLPSSAKSAARTSNAGPFEPRPKS